MVRARLRGNSLGYFNVGADGGRVSVRFNDYHGHEAVGFASITEAKAFYATLGRAIATAEGNRAGCNLCLMPGRGHGLRNNCRGWCADRPREPQHGGCGCIHCS
ncbi:hypothetical protein C3942_21825 [Solimonas fluminis]|uniref:Uncharacterized protein n=2 Tax=Solimonas fluminis TaxID=2086571 RepID=A0A2S5T9W0_9GAMM|nr:hypothetical protein C3942_21825 [Solimonas fluminis]